MKRRDIAELLLLGSLWGASFLFMRIAAPALGPIALAAVRVVGATVLLVPLLAWRGELPGLRRNWLGLIGVGAFNSAIPFVCFAYALVTGSGVLAIFNSASPLFAAVIARAWLGQRLTRWRSLGLAVGFVGVAWIAWTRLGSHVGVGGGSAVAACIVASFCYGVAPSLTQRSLVGVSPMVVAAGSQVAASLMLLLPAVATWPDVAPPLQTWLAAAALAVFCTGIAYILYFRLIASAGPANAIAVTYLVPIFALAWGHLILDEAFSWTLLAACAVIFLGTALATGIVTPSRRLRGIEARRPDVATQAAEATGAGRRGAGTPD